jgi:hypothetical protein
MVALIKYNNFFFATIDLPNETGTTATTTERTAKTQNTVSMITNSSRHPHLHHFKKEPP